MRRLGFGLVLLLFLPTAGSAQTADFLFGRPHGTVAIRTGWMRARAQSDLFTFVQDQLTLQRKDFDAPAIGFDVDFDIAPRATAVAGFDFSRAGATSQYRKYVDNNRLPIKQRTTLLQASVSGSIKVAVTARGREVSQHAWIPSAVTPYVGAGGGLTHFRFSQNGDFVDFVDLSVFSHTFQSTGWAPSAHVFGGVDVKVSRNLYVNGEARYLKSHAALGTDFSGFDPIDLSGLKMTAGLRYMF